MYFILYLTADLDTSRADIEQLKPTYEVVERNSGINYMAQHLVITYDNGHFVVAIEGLPESTLTYNITSEPPTSWFISFKSGKGVVDWEFFEPCIDEFTQNYYVE